VNIDGKPVKLSAYKGKVLVIVNVASQCGYTSQYKQMQEFYDVYKEKGVEILGFPCNQFGGQEPGSEAQIKSFCEKNFGVTFPMFSKVNVKGKEQHPLYKYLTDKAENGRLEASVSWNFNKFVVDKNGQVVAHFKSGTTVFDEDFLKVVEGAM
jgi:glutathione peroxidase